MENNVLDKVIKNAKQLTTVENCVESLERRNSMVIFGLEITHENIFGLDTLDKLNSKLHT